MKVLVGVSAIGERTKRTREECDLNGTPKPSCARERPPKKYRRRTKAELDALEKRRQSN
jgi:hypothetical protein